MSRGKPINLSNAGFSKGSVPDYKSTAYGKQNARNREVTGPPFINPYTFYSTDEPVVRDAIHPGKLSGKIHCSLEVKNPVFIPNTTRRYECDSVDEHYMYDFYSYEDLFDYDSSNDKISEGEFNKLPKPTPIIPGSELRGMVRNMYEILTNSCFSIIDEDNLPYKRTNLPKKPSIMIYNDGEWTLYKNIKKGIDYKTVLYKNTEGQNPGDDMGNGYILHKTIKSGNKRHDIIFKPRPVGKGISVPSEVIKRFENIINSYCDEKVNKQKENPKEKLDLYKAYKKRFDNKQPLFVFTDETNTYLSPSCITKEYFVNTISSILKAQGEHQPCEDSSCLCPACALFGMIGENCAVKGRVRFSDACLSEKASPQFKVITMPILSNPRISSTEFYLKPPSKESDMWNYDYYTYNKIKHSYTPKLSGRKVYWHSSFRKGADKSNMNSTVRALASGEFSFDVYFDRLTEDELKDLLYAITLKKGSVHDMQKIGHGKPVGMGDIMVTAEEITLKGYRLENGEIKQADKAVKPETYETERNTGGIHVFAAQLPGEYAGMVDYPRPAGGDEIYKWFSNNRGSVRNPSIKQIIKPVAAKAGNDNTNTTETIKMSEYTLKKN